MHNPYSIVSKRVMHDYVPTYTPAPLDHFTTKQADTYSSNYMVSMFQRSPSRDATNGKHI